MNSHSLGSSTARSFCGSLSLARFRGVGPGHDQVGGDATKMLHCTCLLSPAPPVSHLISINPLQHHRPPLPLPRPRPRGSWRGRVQLARTWIYSWGWGERSGGRSATISGKERTIFLAFQISKHTAASQEPPSFPGCLPRLFVQKWSSSLWIACVPLRPNQSPGLCYFLIS